MMANMIPLVGSFAAPMFSYVLNHIFVLAFVATVPIIIRSFWRS